MSNQTAIPGNAQGAPAAATTGKRVLIAEDDPVQARVLQHEFQRRGYQVDMAADGMTARARLEKGGYDALVTDWMMPELDGIELVRQLRKTPGRPYVAMLTGLNIPGAKAHAMEAGADDFFSKPVAAMKLVVDVTAGIERHRKNPAAVAPPASPTRMDGDHPLARTAAWKNLPQAVCVTLGEMFQLPFTMTPAMALGATPAIRCMLPLVDAEHMMELHALVVVPDATAAGLAKAMFGDPPPTDNESLTDMTAEIANTIAGAARPAFLTEGFSFTLGLAKLGTDGHPEDYVVSSAYILHAPGVDLGFQLAVRPRDGVLLAVNKLTEGMVLAENLYAPSGGLILPAGSRLTSSAATRIQNLAKGKSILVCVPG
jgi:DNA-binding response OmpR family regulator